MFLQYFNCRHPNIKFAFEVEENNTILFLDIQTTKENNSFPNSIYHKSAFSGVFTNFESFNLLRVFRAFNLCSSFELFHQEIVKLKDIF